MSLRATIFAEIEKRLTDACPGVAIERMPSGEPRPGTEVAIFDGPMRRVQGEVSSARRIITFRVEGSVTGTDGGAEAHDRLNDLHATVVDTLIADPTLGGLVELLEDEDANFDVVSLAEERSIFFVQNFTVQFAAPFGLLSTDT